MTLNRLRLHQPRTMQSRKPIASTEDLKRALAITSIEPSASNKINADHHRFFLNKIIATFAGGTQTALNSQRTAGTSGRHDMPSQTSVGMAVMLVRLTDDHARQSSFRQLINRLHRICDTTVEKQTWSWCHQQSVDIKPRAADFATRLYLKAADTFTKPPRQERVLTTIPVIRSSLLMSALLAVIQRGLSPNCSRTSPFSRIPYQIHRRYPGLAQQFR